MVQYVLNYYYTTGIILFSLFNTGTDNKHRNEEFISFRSVTDTNVAARRLHSESELKPSKTQIVPHVV